MNLLKLVTPLSDKCLLNKNESVTISKIEKFSELKAHIYLHHGILQSSQWTSIYVDQFMDQLQEDLL